MSSTQLSTVAAATAAPSTARETNFQGEFASPVTTESSVADPALKTAEHNHGQDGSIESIKIPLEDDIMQCARLGEVALLQKMFDSRKYDARYQDGEGLTPLHVCFQHDYFFFKELLLTVPVPSANSLSDLLTVGFVVGGYQQPICDVRFFDQSRCECKCERRRIGGEPSHVGGSEVPLLHRQPPTPGGH